MGAIDVAVRAAAPRPIAVGPSYRATHSIRWSRTGQCGGSAAAVAAAKPFSTGSAHWARPIEVADVGQTGFDGRNVIFRYAVRVSVLDLGRVSGRLRSLCPGNAFY